MPPLQRHTVHCAAQLSACGKYRYWLNREWDSSKQIGAFICINPSRATALLQDQTMDNCNNLAVQWNWGGFYILNLFAFMTPDQDKLKTQRDPVGKDNDASIIRISEKSDLLVLAWGNGYRERAARVLSLLPAGQYYCIDRNKGGGYLHPNRIRFEDYPQPVPL